MNLKTASQPPRSVLITGATGAIGAALALEYAAPGQVLTLQGRDAARLAELSARCEARGAQARVRVLDLGVAPALETWRDELATEPAPDLAVLNAGVTSNIGRGGEGERWESVAAVLDLNLKAAIALTEALVPAMRRRGSGQIALVSSLSAYFGLPLTPSYCASKAGLKAYGEALRGWLGHEGIAVNVVMPGFVESPMSDQFPGPRPFLWPPERAARRIRQGLARNAPRVAFPWPLSLGMWWLGVLPVDVSLAILRRLGFGARPRPPR